MKLKNLLLLGLYISVPLILAACSGQFPVAGQEAVSNLGQGVSESSDDAMTLTAGAEADHQADDKLNAVEASTSETAEQEIARPDGWTEATHSNDADPDYAAVFPQDAVNTITLTISPENWAAMQADLTELIGEPGTGGRGGLDPSGEPPSGDFAPPPDGAPDGQGRPGQRSLDLVDGTPIWIDATIEMDGVTWNHVGIRYKGNSSLASGWREGSLKLPFKLDFDQFEDDFPEIDNQRFYGFKQLSLANGFSDDSNMRETLAYDQMHAAGIMSSETAFYEIVLDYGEDPVNLGIYTAVEVIDDTVISTALGDDEGNIYEADGSAVSLAEGTFDAIVDSFEKENNQDEADWSDIEALYAALHADTRTTDPEQWRAGLEAVFDVDRFLNWLAVSAVIGNWDTYGSMNHNYYLYHDPASGQLVWIPWDHNMVLNSALASVAEGEPVARGIVTLDKQDVGDDWPLIRFLLDDSVYSQIYQHHLADASERFDADALVAQYAAWRDLLLPYVMAVGEEADFTAAVEQLIKFTNERDAAVADYVQSQ